MNQGGNVWKKWSKDTTGLTKCCVVERKLSGAKLDLYRPLEEGSMPGTAYVEIPNWDALANKAGSRDLGIDKRV